ncbi:MAG: FecR family protein [Nitrospira sp.]
MKQQHWATMSIVTVALAVGPTAVWAEESGAGSVGFYTAVSGQVSVVHPGESKVVPVKLRDHVLFKDIIETQKESRTKAFFEDDSVLTVGENSRVEITEYIYNPEAKLRRSVVNVLQGQVRALVSKVFKTNGSRFEVHTPSAVAAARGTYFTVWHENGQSGIINIGETGRVDFTSGGVTVHVDPGQYSIADHGKPPSVPAVHGLGQEQKAEGNAKTVKSEDSRGLARALSAVEKTMLRDAPPVGLPTQALHAMDHEAHLAKAQATLSKLAEGPSSGNAYGQNGGNGNGNAYGLNGGNGNGNAFGLIGGATPPAVFTGAGNGVGNGNGGAGGGNGNGNGYGRNR